MSMYDDEKLTTDDKYLLKFFVDVWETRLYPDMEAFVDDNEDAIDLTVEMFKYVGLVTDAPKRYFRIKPTRVLTKLIAAADLELRATGQQKFNIRDIELLSWILGDSLTSWGTQVAIRATVRVLDALGLVRSDGTIVLPTGKLLRMVAHAHY
jgi:hypothetical protein